MATKYFGIFFDGTANNRSDDFEDRSNVARLYDIYTADKLYVRGVGSAIRAGDETFGVGRLRGIVYQREIFYR